MNQKQSTLNMQKIPLIFDPRASPECVSDYVIKQQVYEGKCVKKAALFNATPSGERYLVMALFSHVRIPVAESGAKEPEVEAMAYQYEIQAIPIPQTNGQWKQLAQAIDNP